MQTETHTPESRAAQFAKLLTFEEQQVLVYLYRNSTDDLTIVAQLWVALTDEQIRLEIGTDSDDVTMEVFQELNQDNVEEFVRQLGIPEIIADLG